MALDIVALPMPASLCASVVVCGSPSYFLAGDASYNQKLFLSGKEDVVSPNEEISRETMKKIVALAKERPLVYLPSHDPEGAERLRNGEAMQASTGNL